jgi:hypothetical protein
MAEENEKWKHLVKKREEEDAKLRKKWGIRSKKDEVDWPPAPRVDDKDSASSLREYQREVARRLADC